MRVILLAEETSINYRGCGREGPKEEVLTKEDFFMDERKKRWQSTP
jgi:hypothetical protein